MGDHKCSNDFSIKSKPNQRALMGWVTNQPTNQPTGLFVSISKAVCMLVCRGMRLRLFATGESEYVTDLVNAFAFVSI